MPNTDSIFPSGQDRPPSQRVSPSRFGKAGAARKALVPGVALLAAVSAVLVFFLLSPKASRDGYVLKTWSEATVAVKTIRNIVSATGVIELRAKETILSPETSQVSAVYVEEGDTVRKGQPLVQLVTKDLEWDLVVSRQSYEEAQRAATMTDTEYEFSVREQTISIKTAERNLKTAESTLEQTRGLYERSIASKSELATAENELADAQDALDLAKLTLEQTVSKQRITLSNRASEFEQMRKAIADLEDSVSSCTIRSGTNGKVYGLNVAVGDRVESYATVAVVADPSDIQVGVDVAENRAGEVRPGNAVLVTVGGATVPAVVKSIASSATTSSDSSASTVRVVAGFDAIPPTAIVGGSVSADIEVGTIERALTLPRGPYLSSGNYAVVFVAGTDGRAVKRSASFGISDGNSIQVLSGVTEGERVITSAYQEFMHLAEVGLGK